MTTFRVQPGDNFIAIRGSDDDNKPFVLTMDRVWAMNLALELEDWLNGNAPS